MEIDDRHFLVDLTSDKTQRLSTMSEKHSWELVQKCYWPEHLSSIFNYFYLISKAFFRSPGVSICIWHIPRVTHFKKWWTSDHIVSIWSRHQTVHWWIKSQFLAYLRALSEAGDTGSFYWSGNETIYWFWKRGFINWYLHQLKCMKFPLFNKILWS